ncbi:MAG TPA: hypothetical protein VJJ83_04995 [Candidatus Babeliales bacterium]|nr:hypothetical protein [Candidatus Babeliales bacterium]
MFQPAKLMLLGIILSGTVWQCLAADRSALPQRTDGGAFASRALGRARGGSAFTAIAATPTAPMSTHQRQALTKRWLAKPAEIRDSSWPVTELAASGLPPMRVGTPVADAEVLAPTNNCCRNAMYEILVWGVPFSIWGASVYYGMLNNGPCCKR